MDAILIIFANFRCCLVSRRCYVESLPQKGTKDSPQKTQKNNSSNLLCLLWSSLLCSFVVKFLHWVYLKLYLNRIGKAKISRLGLPFSIEGIQCGMALIRRMASSVQPPFTLFITSKFESVPSVSITNRSSTVPLMESRSACSGYLIFSDRYLNNGLLNLKCLGFEKSVFFSAWAESVFKVQKKKIVKIIRRIIIDLNA